MKTKLVKYLISYLSAAYFIIGGTGFNLVNYCCQSCEKEGIEMVATDSCFAIHHNLHQKSFNNQHPDLFCADITHHLDNCHFIRLNTDTPSFQSIHKLHLEQISTVFLFNSFPLFSPDKLDLSNRKFFPPSDNHFSLSGRSILTFHATLLI